MRRQRRSLVADAGVNIRGNIMRIRKANNASNMMVTRSYDSGDEAMVVTGVWGTLVGDSAVCTFNLTAEQAKAYMEQGKTVILNIPAKTYTYNGNDVDVGDSAFIVDGVYYDTVNSEYIAIAMGDQVYADGDGKLTFTYTFT